MRVAFEDAVKCGGGEMRINIVNIVAFWVSNSVWINVTLSKNQQLHAFTLKLIKWWRGRVGGKTRGRLVRCCRCSNTTGHAVVTAAAHTSGKSPTRSKIRLWAQRMVRAEELIGNHVCGLQTNSVTGPRSGRAPSWQWLWVSETIRWAELTFSGRTTGQNTEIRTESVRNKLGKGTKRKRSNKR